MADQTKKNKTPKKGGESDPSQTILVEIEDNSSTSETALPGTVTNVELPNPINELSSAMLNFSKQMHLFMCNQQQQRQEAQQMFKDMAEKQNETFEKILKRKHEVDDESDDELSVLTSTPKRMRKSAAWKNVNKDHGGDEEGELSEGEAELDGEPSGYDTDEESVDVVKQIDQLLASKRPAQKEKSHKHRDHDENEDHNVPEFVKELSNEFVNDDETGPDVSPDLARLFQNMLRKAALEGKIRDKMARYPRPDNVPLLQAPKVNPEIWSKLKANTRSKDIKMQKCQTKIVKGLVPMAQLLDNLFEQRKQTGQSTQLDHNIQLALDSFQITSQASRELSLRRREQIRPDLNFQYRQLCSPQTEITTNLFGDDLPKTVKDINETNRVGQRVTYPKGNSKFTGKGKAFAPREFRDSQPKNLKNWHRNKKYKDGTHPKNSKQ